MAKLIRLSTGVIINVEEIALVSKEDGEWTVTMKRDWDAHFTLTDAEYDEFDRKIRGYCV